MTPFTTALAVIATCGAISTAAAAAETADADQGSSAARERIQRIFRADEIEACCADKLILPLDHGPRADATPWLNEQRRLHFEARRTACVERASKAR